jgi:predicted  nucleic acid-binding Zn-ribbon protein
MNRITKFIVIALSVAVLIVSVYSVTTINKYNTNSSRLVEVVRQQQDQISVLKQNISGLKENVVKMDSEKQELKKELVSITEEYTTARANIDNLIKKLGGKPQDFQ